MLSTSDETDVHYRNLSAELTTVQQLLNSLSHCCPTPARRRELQQRVSEVLQITAAYLLNYSAALANNTARFTDLFGRFGLIMHIFFKWIKDPSVMSTIAPPIFAIPFSLAAATQVGQVILIPTANTPALTTGLSSLGRTVIMNSAVAIAMIAWIVGAIELLSSSIFKNDAGVKIATVTFSIAASRNLLVSLLQLIASFECVKSSALHKLLATILTALNSMLAQGLANIAAGASVVATAILTFIDVLYNGPKPASENYDAATLTIIGFAVGGIAGLLAVILKNIAPATAETLQTIFGMFHSTFGAANMVVLGTALNYPEIGTAAGFAAHESAINASFVSLSLFAGLGNILRGWRRYHHRPETPLHIKFTLPKHDDYVPVTAKSVKAKAAGNIHWVISVLLYIIGWAIFLLTGFNEALTESLRLTRPATNDLHLPLVLEPALE